MLDTLSLGYSREREEIPVFYEPYICEIKYGTVYKYTATNL